MKKDQGVVLLVVLFLILNLTLGGIATEYVAEFWTSYAKNKPVDIPFFPCFVAGIFLGQFTIPAAALTWLLSFILAA